MQHYTPPFTATLSAACQPLPECIFAIMSVASGVYSAFYDLAAGSVSDFLFDFALVTYPNHYGACRGGGVQFFCPFYFS